MQGMDDATIMDFSCLAYTESYNQQFDAPVSSSRVRVSCTLQFEFEFLARVRVRTLVATEARNSNSS